MSEPSRLRPLKEAARITQMLDLVLGSDRFDRAPVDVISLALEYSRQIAPNSPIHEVVERNIPGCVGALVYGEARPRQWAIMYHVGQSDGRRSFTVGHEFAHYLLHRQLIEQDEGLEGGIYCDENSVDRRGGAGIEQEADEFTAYTHPRIIDGNRLEAGLKIETKYSEYSIPLGSKAEAQQMANTIMQLANERRDIAIRQAVARDHREDPRPVEDAAVTAAYERRAAAR